MKILSTHSDSNGVIEEKPFLYWRNKVLLNEEESLIQSSYGWVGTNILDSIKRSMYQNTLYYFDCKGSNIKRIAMIVSVKKSKVQSVVNDLLDMGYFDKKMYEKYKILTSIYLQEFFLLIAKKRSRCKVEIAYWLAEPIDLKDNSYIVVSETGINNLEQPKASEIKFEQPKAAETDRVRVRVKSNSNSNISFNNDNANQKNSSSSEIEINSFNENGNIEPFSTENIYNEFFKINNDNNLKFSKSDLKISADGFIEYYSAQDWRYSGSNNKIKPEKLGEVIKNWLGNATKSNKVVKPVPMNSFQNNVMNINDDFESTDHIP